MNPPYAHYENNARTKNPASGICVGCDSVAERGGVDRSDDSLARRRRKRLRSVARDSGDRRRIERRHRLGGAQRGTRGRRARSDCRLASRTRNAARSRRRGGERKSDAFRSRRHAPVGRLGRRDRAIRRRRSPRRTRNAPDSFASAPTPDDSRFRRLETLVELRSRWLRLPYGDQGLLIGRALHDDIGRISSAPRSWRTSTWRGASSPPADATRYFPSPPMPSPPWRDISVRGFSSRAARNLLCLVAVVLRRVASPNQETLRRRETPNMTPILALMTKAPKTRRRQNPTRTRRRNVRSDPNSESPAPRRGYDVSPTIRAGKPSSPSPPDAEAIGTMMRGMTSSSRRLRIAPQGEGGTRRKKCNDSSTDPNAVRSSSSEATSRDSTPPDVAEAFRRLRRADVVVGPSPDGGFWLFGARRVPRPPRVFNDARWSTLKAPATTSSRRRDAKGCQPSSSTRRRTSTISPHGVAPCGRRRRIAESSDKRGKISAKLHGR